MGYHELTNALRMYLRSQEVVEALLLDASQGVYEDICDILPVSMLSLTIHVPLMSTASHVITQPLDGMTNTSPGTSSSSVSVTIAARNGLYYWSQRMALSYDVRCRSS